MAVKTPLVVLLYAFVKCMHAQSFYFNQTYQTLKVPCLRETSYTFPGDRESYLSIYAHRYYRIDRYRYCRVIMSVPRGKYISLKLSPFEPTSSITDIACMLILNVGTIVRPSSRIVTYNSFKSEIDLRVWFGHTNPSFNVHIAVRALDKYGQYYLNVTQHTNTSGIIAPYFFDGFTDYAACASSKYILKMPPGHRLLTSFPHFHIDPKSGCISSCLLLYYFSPPIVGWRFCGNRQLPPELHQYSQTYLFYLYTKREKGYTGFKMRFSFHDVTELPGKLQPFELDKPAPGYTNNTVFNCSVPFYATFSQHVICNLETECVHAEDEASCPYWQGDCQPDFLNAGGRCYKYVKTRNRMTWYDASSTCQSQGLTLATFPTFIQGEAFRDGILRYAPKTFKTYIGLRTSDSSLPAIYREAWQWSSRIVAYYVNIESQRLFKPTCGSFAALYRNKLSTTLCGFYEYMHYIFCEAKTPTVLAKSRNISLLSTEINSTITRVNSTRLFVCAEGHVTHDFLSCDHMSRCSAEPGETSCVTTSSINSDGAKTVMNVLMYVCDSQTQTIHYTQVCDHRSQCFDSSDETFCIYQACLERRCLNKQCVTAAQWCDGMAHCSDGSDEDCPQFMSVTSNPPISAKTGFHVVQFDGYGKYKYIPQGKQFTDCPATHFMCVNRELCLPVYLRCNGVYDCADKEDEDNCDNARCLGFYRCRQSAVCVHSEHVCDGMFQCPQQDDELLCQYVCPCTCLCQGLAFVCTRPFPVEKHETIRHLDASGSGLSPYRLTHNHYLVRLALSRCGLRKLPIFNQPNLKFIYLDNNNLSYVKMGVFLKLSNIAFLSLSRNPVTKLIAPESEVVLKKFHSLDLSYTRLKYFESDMLRNIRTLKTLNMSHSTLQVIGDTGFKSLNHLESLDLRGSELKEYPIRMLQPMSSLRVIFSDVYKLCCHQVLPKQLNSQNCHAPHDTISSCKDLLRSELYRMFLWISCCFAVIGNAGSFAAKLYMRKGQTQSGFNIFISNLNVADFFMGLYLIMVGSADLIYKGTYLWNDKEWKTSAWCKTAGFFSLLSCEMSAFIICLVTLDRFLAIHNPFNQVRFSGTTAQVVCGLSWVAGIGLAALPLLPVTSHWEFYSQTDICIPLPVTKTEFKGQFYSFGILIVLNFLLFVLIAVGQVLIYISIRTHSMDTEQRNERDTTVARRLLTVVMSDFLCWFPIGVFGLLAASGVSVPGDISVAMATFALPVNSALNPFLYTFNLLMEKRKKASEQRMLKILQARYSGKLSSGQR